MTSVWLGGAEAGQEGGRGRLRLQPGSSELGSMREESFFVPGKAPGDSCAARSPNTSSYADPPVLCHAIGAPLNPLHRLDYKRMHRRLGISSRLQMITRAPMRTMQEASAKGTI